MGELRSWLGLSVVVFVTLTTHSTVFAEPGGDECREFTSCTDDDVYCSSTSISGPKVLSNVVFDGRDSPITITVNESVSEAADGDLTLLGEITVCGDVTIMADSITIPADDGSGGPTALDASTTGGPAELVLTEHPTRDGRIDILADVGWVQLMAMTVARAAGPPVPVDGTPEVYK